MACARPKCDPRVTRARLACTMYICGHMNVFFFPRICHWDSSKSAIAPVHCAAWNYADVSPVSQDKFRDIKHGVLSFLASRHTLRSIHQNRRGMNAGRPCASAHARDQAPPRLSRVNTCSKNARMRILSMRRGPPHIIARSARHDRRPHCAPDTPHTIYCSIYIFDRGARVEAGVRNMGARKSSHVSRPCRHHTPLDAGVHFASVRVIY